MYKRQIKKISVQAAGRKKAQRQLTKLISSPVIPQERTYPTVVGSEIMTETCPYCPEVNQLEQMRTMEDQIIERAKPLSPQSTVRSK